MDSREDEDEDGDGDDMWAVGYLKRCAHGSLVCHIIPQTSSEHGESFPGGRPSPQISRREFNRHMHATPPQTQRLMRFPAMPEQRGIDASLRTFYHVSINSPVDILLSEDYIGIGRICY